jgi:hypothetical protein
MPEFSGAANAERGSWATIALLDSDRVRGRRAGDS